MDSAVTFNEMSKPSILLTKHIFPVVVERLREEAIVDYEASADGLSAAQLIERAQGKDAILCQVTDRFTSDVLAQLKGVRVIAHVGVGYDNIDAAAAKQHGIIVTNTPGVVDESTADMAFGLMLATARRIPESDKFIRDGKWARWSIDLMIGCDVHHQTLGILGMGRIGQVVARRARGFSMRVLYNNRNRVAHEIEEDLQAEYVSLEQLLPESDFVSIHTPLNPGTRRLIGEAQLKQMKRSAILINTSRGPVVDEAALVRALDEGWIAGAGLDVFEDEPRVHPGLTARSNVVMAPHIASASVATRTKMALMAAENARAVMRGESPINAV